KVELNSIKRGRQYSCRLVPKISYDLRSSERLFCEDGFVRCASQGPSEFTQRPCKATKWGRARLVEPEAQGRALPPYNDPPPMGLGSFLCSHFVTKEENGVGEFSLFAFRNKGRELRGNKRPTQS